MTESASVSIILNASGNLGQVADANTGKLLRLGKAAQGAAGGVSAAASDAAKAVGVLGQSAGKSLGDAGSVVAKFAGPLGALGGIATAAGLAISTAVDLARQRFVAFIEEPAKLAKELRDAARAADELARSRDAALAGKVGGVAGAVEPLIAQGGDAALAFARRLSLDTGASLDDTAGAVLSGTRAGLGEDQIRRLVEGSQLAARAGRAKFADAVAAGLDGGFDASFSPAEMAAEMVNRAALAAHLGGGGDGARGPLPGGLATAADFAAVESNLGASPVARAAQAARRAAAEESDATVRDVAERGSEVVGVAQATARAARANPGLDRYLAEDRKLADAQAVAEQRARSWDFLGPWNPMHGEVAAIARDRQRKTDAFRQANASSMLPPDAAETPDEFMARTSAERDRLERARVQQGLPFGAGVLNVRVINPDDLRSDPLRPAQEGE